MTFNFSLSEEINLHVGSRISADDAARQKRTAREILNRLTYQPGLILADEVGMGKTFVALAVAASVAMQDPKKRPVVIMVPSSLKEKWPKDFKVFQKWGIPGQDLRAERADRPIEFLKLLDDPKETRSSIIFLTHGALSRRMSDGWVKLAMLHRALYRRHDVDNVRRALARFAGRLLHMTWVDRRCPDLWENLLGRPPHEWAKAIQSRGIGLEANADSTNVDDPVPTIILDAMKEMPTDTLFLALQSLPLRETAKFEDNLSAARSVIEQEVRDLWGRCLSQMKLELPLLILDEAHHLKNAWTQTSSLFRDDEAAEDANQISRGALNGAFSRMLFLTATPFQLGHHELCSVLDRFNGIRWSGPEAPPISKEEFSTTTHNLHSLLDEAQHAALTFDQDWGKLHTTDLTADGQHFKNIASWWPVARDKHPDSEAGQAVVASYRNVRVKLKSAETALQPWIIRHLKPRRIKVAAQTIDRRKRISGVAICPGIETFDGTGLPIEGESLLPFLLAARAVATSPTSRPVFAEGLASSYEAFLETRLRNKENSKTENHFQVVDDDDIKEQNVDFDSVSAWYLEQIHEAIPLGSVETSITHPKIAATVDRVLDLWQRGEKVLVFCHYIATGRVLRHCISHRIRQWLDKRSAELLQCDIKMAAQRLEEIGEEISGKSALRDAFDEQALKLIDQHQSLLHLKEDLLKALRQNIRTPTFLARFFPLGVELDPPEAIAKTFATTDASNVTFSELVAGFLQTLVDRPETDPKTLIEECLLITPRSLQAVDVAKAFRDDDSATNERETLMPNVRLANGSTRPETRHRLMTGFNTPFFPEILVASSIMAEGVDLHLNCRHVIHHDLCWNPSTLEQRTGRIDRIGCKMEKCGEPIHIYLPYVAETQDEKMYRVVLDREQWFNVVMGEKVMTSLAATDKLAERLPLPDEVVRELAFDFATFEQSEDADNLGLSCGGS